MLLSNAVLCVDCLRHFLAFIVLAAEVMMVDAARAGGEENGPSPTKRGTPFLVEVNTRWHLTDFAPITDSCVGYNAVDETLSAYVNPERFDSLPRDPPTGAWSRHGRVVHLVSYVAGKLEAIRHEEVCERFFFFPLLLLFFSVL